MTETEKTAVLNVALRTCGIDMRARVRPTSEEGRTATEETVFLIACEQGEEHLDCEPLDELLEERRHVGITLYGSIEVVKP